MFGVKLCSSFGAIIGLAVFESDFSTQVFHTDINKINIL